MRLKIILFMLLLLCGASGRSLAQETDRGTNMVPDKSGGVLQATQPTALQKQLTTAKPLNAGRLSSKATAKARALRSIPALRKAVSLSSLTGTRQVMTHPQDGIMRINQATVTAVGSDSVTISPFIFSDVSIGAKVNTATGAVTFVPQKVATLTEGDVYLCAVDLDNNVYSPKDTISGHVQNGNIHIDTPYGFFIIEGANAGRYLNVGIQTYTYIANSNGTVVSKVINYDKYLSTKRRTVTTQNDWIYIAQISSNQMRIAHLPSAAGYFSIDADMHTDYSVSIDPQAVCTAGLLSTTYYSYPMTETITNDTAVRVSAQVIEPITTTATFGTSDATFTTGKWMLGNTNNGYINLFESVAVTTAELFDYPQEPRTTFKGSGTKSDPWLITSAQDLQQLSTMVNNNNSAIAPTSTSTDTEGESYQAEAKGKYYKLANDIDFSTYDGKIATIGNKSRRFSGTFDGAGHTISNLRFNGYAYDYCGLFGVIGAEGTVKNIKFEKPRVTSIGYNVGVLAGSNYGTVDSISVDNFTVQATAGYQVGGVLGWNRGKASHLNVTNGTLVSLGFMGGAVGRAVGDITYADVSNVTIRQTGSQVFSGGVVGYISRNGTSGPYTKLSHVSFSGTVWSSVDQVCLGGISGEIALTNVDHAVASARVLGGRTQAYVGGLAGAVYSAHITDSYASGMAENKSGDQVGGLIGEDATFVSTNSTTDSASIENCYSSVQVISTSADSLRGITGELGTIKIKNCYFDTQMTGFTHNIYGRTTAELTAGTPLEGLSSSTWTYTAGRYPRLNGSDTTDVELVASAPITMAPTDNVTLVKENFKYNADNGVKWMTITNGEYDTTGGKAFKFQDGTGVLNYQQYTDTIYVQRNLAAKIAILNIAPMPFQGDGTATSPWLITNRKEMNQFSSISNLASLDFAGKYIAVTNDIDMEGDTIVPIDKDPYSKLMFNGHFDGRGHTIDNFVISSVVFYGAGEDKEGQVNPRSDNSYSYAGLFGHIGADGVVKNVTIGSRARFEFFSSGGAIAGHNLGLIDSCRNYANVKAYFGIVGGIVGQQEKSGVVSNSYNAGTVQAGFYQAGGIVGTNKNGKVISSLNAGNVEAVFLNDYQRDGQQRQAGGITGNDTKGQYIDVANTGSVRAYTVSGGLIGQASSSNITRAANYGIVIAANDKSTAGQVVGSGTGLVLDSVYYDSQISKIAATGNNNTKGATALATKDFAAGTLPLGNAWKQQQGTYPTLSQFAQEKAARLASLATVYFQDGDNAESFTRPATLVNTSDVSWSMKNGRQFTISGQTITPTIADSIARDSIVSTLDGVTRYIPVSNINADIFDGTGTAADPYLIHNAQEMVKLASFVNDNDYDYAGAHFKVVGKLDFTGIDYTPVAANGHDFNGDFNGNGYTVSNLTIDKSTDRDATYIALFGHVGSNGTVRNFTLDASNNIAGYQYVAGFVGSLSGHLSHLYNAATIKAGSSYAGGIAGWANENAVIDSCGNTGSVSSINYIGGILAGTLQNAAVEIDSVYNAGTISGTTYLGGITGRASALISNAVNTGDVTATKNYVGGVISYAYAPSSVRNSSNSGTILGTGYVGGIAGYVNVHTADEPFVADSCSNSGTIAAVDASSQMNYGGIIGYGRAGTNISNSWNNADIILDGSTSGHNARNIAGIAGSLTASASAHSSITNCFNTANIQGRAALGGIGGAVDGDTATVISNCWNSGAITADWSSTSQGPVGGIAGRGQCVIANSWNTGAITSEASCTGGIVGDANGRSVPQYGNANFAKVSGSENVGGLIGQGRVQLSDSYNFGSVSGKNNVAGILGSPGNAQSSIYSTHVIHCYTVGSVTATDGLAEQFTGYNRMVGEGMVFASENYFDTDSAKAGATDAEYGESAIKGLSRRELTALQLGNSFKTAEACYPSLIALDTVAANRFFTATVLPSEGETLDSVVSQVFIGTPDSVTWIPSSNLTINGNTVTWTNAKPGDKATLTKVCGPYTRVYELTLRATVSGISTIPSTGTENVVGEQYYTVSGMRIDRGSLHKGDVYIVHRTYADGTSSTVKVRR